MKKLAAALVLLLIITGVSFAETPATTQSADAISITRALVVPTPNL